MAKKVVTKKEMVAGFLHYCASDPVRLRRLADRRAKYPDVDCAYLMWDSIADEDNDTLMWLYLFGGWEDSSVLTQYVSFAVNSLIKEKQLKAFVRLETDQATKH
jgi:hypothetical protein